jgi:hypothetical protein
MPYEDLIEEPEKVIEVYSCRIRSIPRRIRVTIEKSSADSYLGTTDCKIQNPCQATPYRNSNTSLTAEDAFRKAITGITWYLPPDSEKLKETLVIFDDGEKHYCQVED